ncbi:betaine-aldehyde dehydrogenase [Megasphaera vaginalis (ex Bordigoni et al. 2020)]|uniref:betaine-aldehyde dehydrogenase n=1 Tax=Megasphaera vaginalis (ex Bordigoni et al. 2020) TaxID=2045301 RepID=UPI000C7AC49E|nr:betaine-aldehyde dehydrogenase [Megasphaera vaginalis (ex Bordigoni et al. 2020)]
MEKRYICNGKMTYPNGGESSTQYAFTSTQDGVMITINDPNDMLFDYGDHVILAVTKAPAEDSSTTPADTTAPIA